MWLSLVEHLVWDQGVASSNLVTSIFYWKILSTFLNLKPLRIGLETCFFMFFFYDLLRPLFKMYIFPQKKKTFIANVSCRASYLCTALLSPPLTQKGRYILRPLIPFPPSSLLCLFNKLLTYLISLCGKKTTYNSNSHRI